MPVSDQLPDASPTPLSRSSRLRQIVQFCHALILLCSRSKVSAGSFSFAATLFWVAWGLGGDLSLTIFPLVVASVFAGIGWIYVPTLSRTAKGFWVVFSALVFAGVGYWLHHHSQKQSEVQFADTNARIPVLPAFERAFNKFKTKLGDPVEMAIASGFANEDRGTAYQVFFDRASLIYLRNPGVSYVFPSERSKSFTKIEHSTYATKDWWNTRFVRSKLHLPKGRIVPIGDFAKLLYENPSKYGFVGPVIKDCFLGLAGVKSQRFQNGTIIGILPSNPDLPKDGQVLVAFDDGNWSSLASGENAPACMDH